MKGQDWIFSVRYTPDESAPDFGRRAVVGPACWSTVEVALHLVRAPQLVRDAIRAHQTVRDFVEGKLDRGCHGYQVPSPMQASSTWLVCIGPVHEVRR